LRQTENRYNGPRDRTQNQQMRWTRSARRKVALLFNDRAREIAGAAPRSLGLYDFSDGRDRVVLDYFERNMGLKRADGWKIDPEPNHPPLFRSDRKNLYVWICTDHILKVPKEVAEKALVLGLP
jgi:hypothetical protein